MEMIENRMVVDSEWDDDYQEVIVDGKSRLLRRTYARIHRAYEELEQKRMEREDMRDE